MRSERCIVRLGSESRTRSWALQGKGRAGMLEFRVLGSTLEVFNDGVPVKVSRGIQQAILVILLFRGGKPITARKLTEWLWPNHRPVRAEDCLYVHMGVLREALGVEDLIETTPAGYRIVTSKRAFDVEQFSTLVSQARAAWALGRIESAWTSYSQALALFDDDDELMSGVKYPAQLDDEVRNLTDKWLSVKKEWCQAGLYLDRYEDVLPVLRRLYKNDSLNERVYELLLVAEYQKGGQHKALSVYRRIRDTVIEETGLEPSARLRWMHRQILDGKPALSLLPPIARAA